MKEKIIAERPISGPELRELLEKRKDLGFRAQKTLDHLQNVAKVNKVHDLLKKLEGLDVPRLRDVHFCKVADLMPTTSDDVKVVLAPFNLTITKENLQKIADLVKDYIK